MTAFSVGVANSHHFRDADPIQQPKQKGTQLVCGQMGGQGAGMFHCLPPPESNVFSKVPPFPLRKLYNRVRITPTLLTTA